MPERLVRELVLYYVGESAHTHNDDHLLAAIVSAVCDVPVTAATIFETTHTHARCARIVLPTQHSERFARIFPSTQRLHDPAPGLAGFRLVAQRRTTRETTGNP
jgi:hypothetical protein